MLALETFSRFAAALKRISMSKGRLVLSCRMCAPVLVDVNSICVLLPYPMLRSRFCVRRGADRFFGSWACCTFFFGTNGSIGTKRLQVEAFGRNWLIVCLAACYTHFVGLQLNFT